MYRLRLESCLLLGAALLVGCSDRKTPTAPAGPVFSTSGAKRAMVPFKERYQATGTAGPSTACPILQVRLHGGGTATLLGRYTITNSHCLDPSTGEFTNGAFTKTAANGDQLFGTYHGQTLPDNTLVGSLAFTGGTGRFADATGNTTMRGRLTIDPSQPEPLHIVLTIEGTISSPGGLK